MYETQPLRIYQHFVIVFSAFLKARYKSHSIFMDNDDTTIRYTYSLSIKQCSGFVLLGPKLNTKLALDHPPPTTHPPGTFQKALDIVGS